MLLWLLKKEVTEKGLNFRISSHWKAVGLAMRIEMKTSQMEKNRVYWPKHPFIHDERWPDAPPR